MNFGWKKMLLWYLGFQNNFKIGQSSSIHIGYLWYKKMDRSKKYELLRQKIIKYEKKSIFFFSCHDGMLVIILGLDLKYIKE